MTTNQKYWRRTGFVEIADDDGNMVRYGGSHDGLDFKFSGVINGEINPNFSVSILGLSKETMVALTTWNPSDAYSKKRKINVYAGYSNDDIARPILSGIVLRAFPTQPPEAWLNLDCVLNPFSPLPVVKPETKKLTLEEILDKIAKMDGYNSRWDSKKLKGDNTVIYNFNRSPKELVRDFSDRFNVLLYVEDNVLIAKDFHGERGDPEDLEMVSMDTGMLGLNHITLIGATIVKRLESRTKCFSWLNVRSKLVPKANGSFYVINKKYLGHFRGQEWYTELNCHRKVIV